MAQISISEASRRWRVSRSTIYRRIVSGELSTIQGDTGVRQVEISELVRVFGEPDVQVVNHDTVGGCVMKQGDHVSIQIENSRLNEKVSLLEREIMLLRQQLDDLRADKAWLQDQMTKSKWQKLLPWFGKKSVD